MKILNGKENSSSCLICTEVSHLLLLLLQLWDNSLAYGQSLSALPMDRPIGTADHMGRAFTSFYPIVRTRLFYPQLISQLAIGSALLLLRTGKISHSITDSLVTICPLRSRSVGSYRNISDTKTLSSPFSSLVLLGRVLSLKFSGIKNPLFGMKLSQMSAPVGKPHNELAQDLCLNEIGCCIES